MLNGAEMLKMLRRHELEIKHLKNKLHLKHETVNCCLQNLDLQVAIFQVLSRGNFSPVEILRILKLKHNIEPTRPDLQRILKQLLIDGYVSKSLPVAKGYVKYFLTDKGESVVLFLSLEHF